MPTNQLYHTLLRQIKQLRPQERITRLVNFTWLMTGIYLSKSVHLSKVATKVRSAATLPSITRRLSRFLDNGAVRVRDWYEPVAQELLPFLARTVGEIRLIADGSKVGFGHQLLIISVAYRRRAIPIVWTWVKGARGHSSATKQLALLAYVRGLLPTGVPVLLVGDSEFGAVEVIRQVEAWGWLYVLRQKANNQIRLANSQEWVNFGDLIQKPGQSLWLGRGLLTRQYAHSVNLLAHWAAGEDEAWLLATNLSSRQDTLQAYGRRMWIEEMFGDLKGNGFDLESTHLHHFLRLSRLTLVAVLLYVWLVAMGSRVIRRGERRLVDRNDRRDLSIFQIGLRWIERCLTNDWHFSIYLCPV